MSTKTLKIKRVFAWTIYNNLRRIAPKDYTTTAEIKSTLSDVLPALKPLVETYVGFLGEVEDLQEKINNKEVTVEEADPTIKEIDKKWREYNKGDGSQIVDIELTEEGLKTLKEQFEREGWGKKWVMNIEEFGEILTSFEQAAK